MRAGRLRHQIEIQAAVTTADEYGDPVTTWATIGTARAEVSPVGGKEATYGNQTLAEMDTKIYVRWSPLTEAITARHRILHQGTIFNIVSAAQIMLGKRSIELRCKSGINDG